MLDKAVLLSHPKYNTKNIKLIVRIFLENDYPLDFIFNTINLRLKSLIHKVILQQQQVNNYMEDETAKKCWFIVPYLSSI